MSRSHRLSSTPPPHIPARLSQDTQEQETTQGRPWLTKSSGTQHPLSSSIIHHPLSLMFGFTPNLLGTTCENKQRGKRKYAHPNIHLPTPCTQSTVLWQGGLTLLKVSWGIEDSDCHCKSEIGQSNNGFLVDLGHRILSFQVPLEAKIDSQVDICWILLRGVLLACGLPELHFCWISSVSWKKLAASDIHVYYFDQ